MSKELILGKLAFDGPNTGPDRGFTIKAHYLAEPSQDALVEIFRDGKPYRRFLYPAYRIWNIAAHFEDIVTSEINGDGDGYDLAGWAGFHIIEPRELPIDDTEQGLGNGPITAGHR